MPLPGNKQTARATHLHKKTHIWRGGHPCLSLRCAALTILTTIGIVFILLEEAVRFFLDPEVTLWEFFTGAVWQPKIARFGILPLLTATLITTGFAMLVAIPLGLSIAIYLSEYAIQPGAQHHQTHARSAGGDPDRGLRVFCPDFYDAITAHHLWLDTVGIYNTASAGIVMGILILPLVATMSEDALSAVPRSLREGAYGLGATRLEVALKIVVPAAISGIAAAIILGISRGDRRDDDRRPGGWRWTQPDLKPIQGCGDDHRAYRAHQRR